ncbi:MAG: 30S ribosomal protein S5 [Patescibacteria group bacterium]|nr:30S ribosomal protein S5 [Patescibacteria group bacterium]MDE2589090.1 30S ribosomal protein S5 [Patescibacteria group bacterium]
MAFNPQQSQQRGNRQFGPQIPSEFAEDIVQINRVSKKTKGGNKIGFAVLAVVGNKKGKVGVGHGKAADVAASIRKAVASAKRQFIEVPIVNGTIPFGVRVKRGAAKIMLKPAPKGSGVIAGGAVRSVVAAAGIENISSKVLGTNNKASNVYATIEALKQIAAMQNKFSSQKKEKKG